MTREWETWLNMSGSWCMPLMRPQPLSQRLSWLTSTKFWKTTMAARQNAAMRRPEDFQDGEVWLMVKLGDLNPARLLVKRRLQKLDAEALEAEHSHICGASGMDHRTKAQKMQLIFDKLETNGTFKHQQTEWDRQARTGCNQSSVHDVCKTTEACSTLGSSAAMLTIVKSVKTMTKSVSLALLDNQNRTQAGRHMEMWSIS